MFKIYFGDFKGCISVVLVDVSSFRTEVTGLKQFDFLSSKSVCPSVILAESVILPIMLNQKIMNPSYGGYKSGACFIEVKCSSTF